MTTSSMTFSGQNNLAERLLSFISSLLKKKLGEKTAEAEKGDPTFSIPVPSPSQTEIPGATLNSREEIPPLSSADSVQRMAEVARSAWKAAREEEDGLTKKPKRKPEQKIHLPVLWTGPSTSNNVGEPEKEPEVHLPVVWTGTSSWASFQEDRDNQPPPPPPPNRSGGNWNWKKMRWLLAIISISILVAIVAMAIFYSSGEEGGNDVKEVEEWVGDERVVTLQNPTAETSDNNTSGSGPRKWDVELQPGIWYDVPMRANRRITSEYVGVCVETDYNGGLYYVVVCDPGLSPEIAPMPGAKLWISGEIYDFSAETGQDIMSMKKRSLSNKTAILSFTEE